MSIISSPKEILIPGDQDYRLYYYENISYNKEASKKISTRNYKRSQEYIIFKNYLEFSMIKQ